MVSACHRNYPLSRLFLFSSSLLVYGVLYSKQSTPESLSKMSLQHVSSFGPAPTEKKRNQPLSIMKLSASFEVQVQTDLLVAHSLVSSFASLGQQRKDIGQGVKGMTFC